MLGREAALLPLRKRRAAQTARRPRADEKGPLRSARPAKRCRKTGSWSKSRPAPSSSPNYPTDEDGQGRRNARSPGWFALNDESGALGQRNHRTEAGIRAEHSEPNVAFKFTDAGPGSLPGRHPADRPARPGAGDRPGQRRRSGGALRPLRGHPRQRSPEPADHQLRRKPGRDRRPPGRPDLRRLLRRTRARTAQELATTLQIGALPINLQADLPRPRSRRPSARRRSTTGSRPGSSASPSSSSSCSLYYRFLGLIAVDRAGRLRGDLLRPDQTDPDHPDPAGDRRPGADDRRRRRLEHRHLRANKGGGAGRSLDVERDHRWLQTRDLRRSSTRTSSPC